MSSGQRQCPDGKGMPQRVLDASVILLIKNWGNAPLPVPWPWPLPLPVASYHLAPGLLSEACDRRIVAICTDAAPASINLIQSKFAVLKMPSQCQVVNYHDIETDSDRAPALTKGRHIASSDVSKVTLSRYCSQCQGSWGMGADSGSETAPSATTTSS
jgi:hypothetical protein